MRVEAVCDTGSGADKAFLTAALPVLLAAHLGRVDIFAGPEIQAGRHGKSPYGAVVGHVGVALPLGEPVHVVPELSLLWAFKGDQTYDRKGEPERSSMLTRSGLALQVGAGFTFGGSHRRARP